MKTKYDDEIAELEETLSKNNEICGALGRKIKDLRDQRLEEIIQQLKVILGDEFEVKEYPMLGDIRVTCKVKERRLESLKP